MPHNPDDKGHLWHYLAGFVVGIPLRFIPSEFAARTIRRIDRFGWNREVKQAGKPKLNPHKIAEAKAWGLGARRSSGVVSAAFPVPPYPA